MLRKVSYISTDVILTHCSAAYSNQSINQSINQPTKHRHNKKERNRRDGWENTTTTL